MDEGEYWKKDVGFVCKQLSSSPDGLSTAEANVRLKKHGLNSIPDKDKREWLQILSSQLSSPLLLILIAASLISAFLGDVFDTVIILAVVFASALLGFFQEYKSEKTLSELKKYFSYHATVLRDGEKVQVDAKELVPGDVVFVGLGDIIPADMRLIDTKQLLVNESVLTGESREVQKTFSLENHAAASPQEISNCLFTGTLVVDGYAKGIAVATGKDTFFGKTASVFSAKVPESDFQLGIRKFGDLLIKVILALTLFIFISNYALGHGDRNALSDSALFALALAVGIAPEALPAVITLTLSSGSLRLAKKKVITKKLAAIEDLGNMDVLCTDKTGTLTEEGIRVEKYIDLDERDNHGIFEYAFLCNSAVGSLRVKGNAIDVAVRKQGLHVKLDVSHFKKIQSIDFDYTRRRMGQIVQEGRNTLLIVKGAPESVLSVCSKIKIRSKLYAASEKQAEVKKMISAYNASGYSAIAVAYKNVKAKKEYTENDENGLTLIGFILLANPPKQGVQATLERLKQLNVRLKILTGDDALVTKKLCSDISFKLAESRIILGSELKEMSEKEFSQAVERFDVFARVTPDQKLAIVEKLRENGHVVGFMGDGINDAPALRTADVGISVSTAADVAKSASHIILLQKNLNVVCDGVAGGRNIFGNITKYILNTMSANSGNMVTVAISSLFLPFIPLLPSQILLNNLLSDIPLMSIASDNVDKSYTRKPQKWNISLIMKFMLFFGVISSLFDLLLIFMLYFVFKVDMNTFRTAWFLESLLSEMIIVFSLRTHLPFFRSMPSKLLAAASISMIAASIAIIYFPPAATIFYFVPLDMQMLSLIAGILVAYFALTEIGKVIFFKYVEPTQATQAMATKK